MNGEDERSGVANAALSTSQMERIKRNRERAKSIRQARLESRPYDTNVPATSRSRTEEKAVSWRTGVCSTIGVTTDTGGGFILDEDKKPTTTDTTRDAKNTKDDAPVMPDEQIMCLECRKKFAESFLLSKFKFSVCDECRDSKEKHSLITKTESKQRYLLKDCDFGERGGPPLPFILKRNPHGSYKTDMHLYLRLQVEERAHEVWGGEEGLEEERERKKQAREKKKEKKYVKDIQRLRKAVRSGATISKAHEHVYSKETYSSETDLWTKTCEECGHSVTYEKM